MLPAQVEAGWLSPGQRLCCVSGLWRREFRWRREQVQTEIGSAEVGGSENPNLRQAVAGVSEQGCLHKRREGG